LLFLPLSGFVQQDVLGIDPNYYERCIDSDPLTEIKHLEITLSGCSYLEDIA
jgi:hypothetical protein